MSAAQVLESHPTRTINISGAAETIDACLECVTSCTACADACISEDDPAAMAVCIRTDLDCADICSATARVLARQSETQTDHIRALLQACHEICRICATECERHDHQHCIECAKVCRRCEKVCRSTLTNMH